MANANRIAELRQAIEDAAEQHEQERYVVMTSGAKPCGGWSGYINVAVVECAVPGIVPRQIHPRHRSVASIPFFRGRIFGGSMIRSAGARALARAEEIARGLNAAARLYSFAD